MAAMNKILECVPNFSEGRDLKKIEKIVEPFRGRDGVKLLDYQNDEDHNRSVVTAVGEPEELKAAVNVGIGIGLKKLVTVDEPVFQPERKKELSKYGELVDMEGYAVARVCEAHNIPCIMIKGVTDFGDGDGKEDIQTHIAPVSETVANAVFGIVDESSSLIAQGESRGSAATRQETSSAVF